jgi:hypothetical protein
MLLKNKRLAPDHRLRLENSTPMHAKTATLPLLVSACIECGGEGGILFAHHR